MILTLLTNWLLLSMASASLRSVVITSEQTIPAPRWMYETGSGLVRSGLSEDLMQIKKAKLDKKYDKCYRLAKAQASKSKGLEPWLLTEQLSCLIAWAKSGAQPVGELSDILEHVNKKARLLVLGPQVDTLKPLVTEGTLVLFELQLRNSRRHAWQTFDRLQEMRAWLDESQMARVYRTGGELAFVEQKITVAAELYGRSLDVKDSDEIRKRLVALKPLLSNKKEIVTEAKSVKEDAPPLAYGHEYEISQRMQRAMQSGDLISAVEDGVQLIKQFPGSVSARWANDKILEVYLNLAQKNDGDGKTLRSKVIDAMVGADGARCLRWAQNAYAKGQYSEALRLSEAALSKLAGLPDSTKAVALAAESALAVGNYSALDKWAEKLVIEHAGTDEAKEALFRLGLLRVRQKRWADAAAYFERLMAIGGGTTWEYDALYWQWRSQQKLKSATAKQLAERLVARYPLTYYGLRARAELNSGLVKLNGYPSQTIKTEIWLSESQSQAWERLQLLLKAGWFDEAQAELQALPEPRSLEDKLVRARLLAAAFDHYRAIRLFNEVWEQKNDSLTWSSIKTAFAREYKTSIEKASKTSSLRPSLVWGLMRQESSFREKIVSPSQAVGLMQLLPQTAEEVATQQKWKAALVLPDDLFIPDNNIRLGTVYLARLIRAFKGHVPLALASYNAGIGRMRRWLSARDETANLENQLTSEPENEVWIDELPWDETRTYVKSIMRNFLIYESLNEGQVKMSDPIWATNSP